MTRDLIESLTDLASQMHERAHAFASAIEEAMKSEGSVVAILDVCGMYQLTRPGCEPVLFAVHRLASAETVAAAIDAGFFTHKSPRTPEGRDPKVGTEGFS